MKHFLLIRFSSLGDVVLSTSVIKQIKKNHPKAKITFLTARPFQEILKGHPDLDHVLFIDRKTSSLGDIKRMLLKYHQEHPIDLVLDLHASLRSRLLSFMVFNIPFLRVNKRTFLRNVLVWLKKDFLKKEFQIDRLNKDLTPFLGPFQRQGQVQTSLPSFDSSLEKKGHIVIAPGASFVPKAWPYQSFQRLIKDMEDHFPEKKIVLVGSPGECPDFREEKNVINKIGKTSLAELCSLIESAELVICNDSAVGHIAEAYHRKVISLMGPTHESFGFALHSPKSFTFSHELSCRPCSTKGNKACFKSEPFCFTKTLPSDVLNKAIEMLSS